MTEIPFDLPRATALLTAIADGADTARENRQSFEVSPNVTAELRSISRRLLAGEERIATLEDQLAKLTATHAANVQEYTRMRDAITSALHFVATSRASRSSEGSPNT